MYGGRNKNRYRHKGKVDRERERKEEKERARGRMLTWVILDERLKLLIPRWLPSTAR